ncbi:spore germination protein GerC [Paenibacillus agaridevorans]|uniref:Spore germination protein GerC n=1 Tax=Paenibacillus agaridevorans TaxID=171404 RepID=A0A2R5EWZ6_9BACL|nr:Ger(x)C family spore germination protein [Paenibacillus agaridevorans]GBG11067.1 spore germination protein GerC [Paenibacillus agaridevorans]
MTLKRLALAASVLIMLLVSGACTAMPDIQSNAYATAIGIDYKNGEWIAYAQVINFSTVAHSDQVDLGPGKPVWIGSGKGDTVASALIRVGETSQLRLFWGHVQVLVISEEALKKGVQDIYSAINRYREVRYTVYVYGTKQNIRDVLMQKSIVNMAPLYTMMFTGTQSASKEAFILPVKANRVIAHLNEPGEPAAIPSVGIDGGEWTEDEKPKKMIRLTGMYFFRNNRMSSWMPLEDLYGLRWIEEDLERTPLLIRREGKPLAVLMLSHPRSSVKAISEGEGSQFRIQVKVKGFVMEIMDWASIKEMEKLAEEAIAQEVEMTFREGVKKETDPFGLMEELYRSNPSRFRKETTGDHFMLSNKSLAEVVVRVRLTNTGKYQGKPP